MGPHLPLALDSFVGRLGEAAELGMLLGESRLVTITGPPDIGKSRLALEISTRLKDKYHDGVWLVDLAPISDEELVAPIVARALSVRESAEQDVADNLLRFVRDRHLLLVVDNCEHLLGACASLADRLVRSAVKVSVLLTSRERLGTAGERVLTLGPLSLGAVERPGEAGGRSEAVELFVARAQAIQPTFSLNSQETLVTVEDICRRVEGVPLAIELIAARVGTLSLSVLAARLGEGLAVLAGGGRSTNRRHNSMQVALDWSHELLTVPEQTLLRRLSIFTAGWGDDAVPQVCGGGSVTPGAELDHLSSLVSKSLVLADTSGPTARYRLQETVRLYAHEHLVAAGEVEALAARHGRWYVGVGERAERGLATRDQVEWLERLDADHDNLRAALSWALSGGHVEEALRLAGGLVLFWRLRGYWSEGRRCLTAALKASEEAPAALRAKCAWGAGFLSHMMADTKEALQLLELSLNLAREGEDPVYEGRANLLLGNVCQKNDSRGAVSFLEQAVAAARKNDDVWCLGHGLGLIGRAYVDLGDPEAARLALEECITTARGAGELQSLRLGLTVLGDLRLLAADFRQAKAPLEEAMAVSRLLAEPNAIAGALVGLSRVALWERNFDRAREHLDEALTLARRAGGPGLIVHILSHMGELAADLGDLATALRHFEEVVDLANEIDFPTAGPVLGLARVHVKREDLVQASRLYRDAAELARDDGDKHVLSVALSERACLARKQGKVRQAGALHDEALEIGQEIGNWARLAYSLEGLAALACDAGRFDPAARLFAAAESLRNANGWEPSSDYGVERAAAQQALGSRKFAQAWAQGRSLSPAEAVSYARRRRGARQRPASGWGALTRVEHDVVGLVVEGLTNAEVAERLFISPRTVAHHLQHIYAKVGVASRRELSRLVREGEPQPEK